MPGNDVPSPATFLLTRNAALDLRRIYTRSRREWGDDIADRYLADLYAAMGVAAANPEKGRLRQYRSAPFLMVPARQHFSLFSVASLTVSVFEVVFRGVGALSKSPSNLNARQMPRKPSV